MRIERAMVGLGQTVEQTRLWPNSDGQMADRVEIGMPAPEFISSLWSRRAVIEASQEARVEANPAQYSLFQAADLPRMKTVTFVFDARRAPEVQDVELKGSFNPETGRFDPRWNGGKGVAMRDDGQGGDEVKGDKVYTAQVRLVADQPEEFHWGVVGDVVRNGSTAKDQWLVMQEVPPSFRLDESSTQGYAPVTTHLFGVHREGRDGVRFQTWSPEVGRGDLKDYRLYVDVSDSDGQTRSLLMQKDEKTGVWTLRTENGWSELKGKAYQYAARKEDGTPLRTKDGSPVVYSDPHARYLQGPQRGVERIFVDPVLGFETGWYDDSGKGGPNYADNPQWGRFTVDANEKSDNVRLVLKDENGRQMTKADLLARLGEPKLVPYDQARPEDKRDVDVLRNWKLDKTEPIVKYSWLDRVHEDGSIDMVRVDSPRAGTAWVTAVNNFPKLVGMRYEFQAFQDGKLVGDKSGDGVLQDGERKALPFNDPYSDVISARPGSARKSLVRESSYEFRFDSVPRKQDDFRKFVIYEAHVGSFMSSPDNAVPATFEDMIRNLDYLEALGVDSIETMPIQDFGGKRDWGYTPDFYYAGSDAYGFEMDRAQAVQLKLIEPDEQPGSDRVWISGTDALKLFVDESHKRGFNVFADVVYNHTSGKADGDDPLGRIDGDKRSFFQWWGKYESFTPWGAKPNYANQNVKDFFTDNAVQQVQEFGFDGIRFDFTQVLHNTGNTAEQIEGMNTLRQINRTLQFVKPGSYTVAEDFSGNWLVAAGLDSSEWQGPEGPERVQKKGMGFQNVWNDRFHDDLLEMAQGHGNADRLLDGIQNHHGVSGWDRGVVYAHSHDEVGNTGNWIARGAAASKEDHAVRQPYPRSVQGTASAITLLGPGVPMIFQGEEFLANNDFKHGLTATWGADMRWLDFQVTPDRVDHFRWMGGLDRSQQEIERSRLSPDEQALFDRYAGMSPEQRADADHLANQAGQFRRVRDLIALRRTSSAFAATGGVWRHYSHNADRVTAFKRADSASKDEFLVVSNFADQDRPGYKVPLPEGEWREVFNTNARCYGGTNTGNGGGTVSNASGVYLPAGATVVLKRVG